VLDRLEVVDGKGLEVREKLAGKVPLPRLSDPTGPPSWLEPLRKRSLPSLSLWRVR
jgi:hypothetical protein